MFIIFCFQSLKGNNIRLFNKECQLLLNNIFMQNNKQEGEGISTLEKGMERAKRSILILIQFAQNFQHMFISICLKNLLWKCKKIFI